MAANTTADPVCALAVKGASVPRCQRFAAFCWLGKDSELVRDSGETWRPHAPGVEDGGLDARVGAHDEDEIRLLQAQDGGVGDVIGAHIRVQVRKARLVHCVAAAQRVQHVLWQGREGRSLECDFKKQMMYVSRSA